MVLGNGYETCIYLGCAGDFQRVQLIATDGHGAILCSYINAVAPTGGSLRWGHGTCVVNNEDEGAMKAEG